MSIELLQTISLISYIIAGVFFLIAIALFFLLDIKKVIGEVSGATERKAIESIRLQNETDNEKTYKSNVINAERSRLTDKISKSGKLVSKHNNIESALETEKFDTTKLNPSANETTMLDETKSYETTDLSSQTTLLIQNSQTVEKINEVTVHVEMGFAGSSELIE